MSTKLLVLVAAIIISDGFARASKVNSRIFPTSYSYGYSHPTASTRQKDVYQRYPTTNDLSPYSHNHQPDRIQSFDIGSGSSQFVHSNGQETWSPPGWNATHFRYPNGYVRSNYYRDPVEGSHSMYQYQHVRPPLQTGYVTYKKPSPYYGKGKFVKPPEHPKHKKPQYLYYNGQTGYKKTVYPRLYTPYSMHKYPIKKTAHPYYRRYYQMPHAVSSADMLRNKVNNIYAYGDDSSTAAIPVTTDRVYNADGNDYSATTEDYSLNYNDTYPIRSSTYPNYYGNYEETERTTSEPISYEESSTRGYYGDRIYMSSQVASQSAEKGIKNRFYVVRNEPEEDVDDLETIFD